MLLINDDCIEGMKNLPDQSIDMILTDPPYGTTKCKWDTIIPLDDMWEQVTRIIKPNGAIVFTASQPFTSKLVMSNPDWFKYELIWEKTNATGHFLANLRVMKAHENILVFYDKQPTYNPQKEQGKPYEWKSKRTKSEHFDNRENTPISNKGDRFPRSVKKFKQDRGLHPTQKPVLLMEYLISTFTNEDDVVLDFTMGSGTTGVACKHLNRDFIGIEKDVDYWRMSRERIGDA